MTPTALPPLPDRPLSVCIVGAGAIGGTIAARLALAAEAGISQVSVIARGDHLAAIREKGLRLKMPASDQIRSVAVTATDNPDDLPPQDLVITALKGHQIPPMAEKLARLTAPHGRILTVVNGVPWWYPIKDGKGGFKGADEVDPGGVLWREVGPERAIGAVAVLGALVPEPGLIEVSIDGYFDLGRLPGQDMADVDRVAALFRAAGIGVQETRPYQNAIFTKLFSNCAFNSVCAVARLPMEKVVDEPILGEATFEIMREVTAIGRAEGAEIPMTPEQRAEIARKSATFKPSTLQDLEKGRPMEIEPIFGAAISVARSHGIPCPMLELMTAILRSIERARTAES